MFGPAEGGKGLGDVVINGSPGSSSYNGGAAANGGPGHGGTMGRRRRYDRDHTAPVIRDCDDFFCRTGIIRQALLSFEKGIERSQAPNVAIQSKTQESSTNAFIS